MTKLFIRPPLLPTVALLTLFVPSLAYAHVGVGQTTGFLHGFGHPFSGLDHICAMVAIGLWAAQCGGKAVWIVPFTFVLTMAFGGFLGVVGVSIPFVEEGIILSVLVLGSLVAVAGKLPLIPGAMLVGLFAIFHGHAHGAEMPSTASGLAYGAGFVLATSLLHIAGICIQRITSKAGYPRYIKMAGSAIATCGVYLFLSYANFV